MAERDLASSPARSTAAAAAGGEEAEGEGETMKQETAAASAAADDAAEARPFKHSVQARCLEFCVAALWLGLVNARDGLPEGVGVYALGPDNPAAPDSWWTLPLKSSRRPMVKHAPLTPTLLPLLVVRRCRLNTSG